MASKRKFYRTVVTVEILSEEPFDGTQDLQYIHYEITDGDCSGNQTVTLCEEVDAATMAKLLVEQGSDPEFFQLDEDGNDLLEEDEVNDPSAHGLLDKDGYYNPKGTS